jgi:hypothetical protein
VNIFASVKHKSYLIQLSAPGTVPAYSMNYIATMVGLPQLVMPSRTLQNQMCRRGTNKLVQLDNFHTIPESVEDLNICQLWVPWLAQKVMQTSHYDLHWLKITRQ